MRRRPLVARTAAGAGALAMLAGCTFLIDFDEVPRATDGGGVDGATPIGPPDVRVDSNVPDTADAAPPGDALANPDACKGHIDGKYCGNDMITWPLEHKDDLVTCKASQVSVVKLCATGQGCLGMLNGFPDECDECAKKGDGTFCGRDFPGWDPKNAQQRIRCQSGRVVGSLLCTVCKSNGTNSACQ
jgi:hypothetical protein